MSVLDSNFNVRKNYFIEASAGTGKTFSIVNAVVRLLIEREDPLLIDQILIITFTNEATRELKHRVHAAIEETLNILTTDKHDNLPDYLQNFILQDKGNKQRSIKFLKRALFSFDSAQIMTIHSFCFNMLSENAIDANITLNDKDEIALPKKIFVDAIKDYFRVFKSLSTLSTKQLQLCLKKYQQNGIQLTNVLTSILSKEIHISPQKSTKELYEKFKEKGKELFLKRSDFWSIIDEVSVNYNGVLNKSKKIKEDVYDCFLLINKFVKDEFSFDDFEKLIEFSHCLKKISLKKQNKIEKHKNIIEGFFHQHLQYVFKASHPHYIIGQMAHEISILLNNHIKKHEKISPNSILQQLESALENPNIFKTVVSQYRAAIIDEFQDTDPVQWNILSKLFLLSDKKIFLYLVGDPKQSIYAFRDADIYTYLKAAKELGDQNKITLSTNYRSQLKLIEGLNFLFSSSNSKFIDLPRLGLSLSYQPVKGSKSVIKKDFSDAHGSIHFMVAKSYLKRSSKWPSEEIEKTLFFPFIANEITNLYENAHQPLNSIAILVRDKFQRERLENYLNNLNFPTKAVKGLNLLQTGTVSAFKELLRAVLLPRQTGLVKKALLGDIFKVSEKEFFCLKDEDFSDILANFYNWHHILLTHGLGPFFQNFLETKLFDSSVGQRILSCEIGVDLLLNLRQLVSILIEEEQKNICDEKLIVFLENLENSSCDIDTRFLIPSDSQKQAIQILTMHSSKGLEFDVVFALGLMNRTSHDEVLYPINYKDKKYLKPLLDVDKAYEAYCQEIDAEKMRQLYVTLTRAKQRVYIPLIIDVKEAVPKIGQASPIELFISNFIHHSFLKIYQSNFVKVYDDFLNQIHKSLTDTTSSTLNSFVCKSFNPKTDLSLRLEIPSKPLVTLFPKEVHSFSSLSYSSHLAIGRAPTDFNNLEKSIYTLPAGSTTGSFLHSILEQCSWNDFCSTNFQEDYELLLSPFLENTPFQGWLKVFSSIFYNLFHTELSCDSHTFFLKDVNPVYMKREMEFFYPYSGEVIPNEIVQKNDYLQGFIDLVFEVDNKVFVLDYKSNWLGENRSFYDKTSIEKVMYENQYMLQAKIYLEAMQRYLSNFNNKQLKGAYYLFLRGLSKKGEGVYFIKR